MSMFQVLNAAETEPKGGLLQTDFQQQQSDSRDHGLHSPSSSVELLA